MRAFSVVFCHLCAIVCACVSAAFPITLDFSPTPLERLQMRNQERLLTLSAGRCAQPPAIDGVLSDQAWGAAGISEVPAANGAGAMPRTLAMVCFDDAAIYIGVKCSQLGGAKPKAEQRERDTGAWKDDCVELWFDPSGKAETVYQFIVNAVGSVYDQRSGVGDAYNPDWQQAVTAGEDAWSVEVAIPLAALELSKWPKRLNFNIGRNGPDIGARALAGGYADTAGAVLSLEATAEAGTVETTPVNDAERLVVRMDRTSTRPGERLLEADIRLNTTGLQRAGLRLVATVEGKNGGGVSEQAEVIRDRCTATLDIWALGGDPTSVIFALHDADRAIATVKQAITVNRPEGRLAPGTRIPVHLSLPEGIDRVQNWPVHIGVPLPEGALAESRAAMALPSITLVDNDGEPIPHGKQVAGRWAPGGAYKWLAFTAWVDSDKGCNVVAGPARGEEPRRPGSSEWADDGTITIDTTLARYVLGKGTSPIRDIYLDGDTPFATTEGTRGLYVVDQKGRVASATADTLVPPREVLLSRRDAETQAGGLRFEGPYLTADGEELARHITSVQVCAGQPFARITHTLVLTRDTNEVWFTDIGWEFAVRPGADAQAVFGVSRDEWRQTASHPLGAGMSASMLQDSHYVFAHGENHCSVSVKAASGAQTTIHEGEECGDWAMLSGSSGALEFSCREAALQHPKQFEVGPDRVVMHLFSNAAGEELDFRPETLAKKWDLLNWYEAVIPKAYRLTPEQVMEKMREHTSNAVGWSKTHDLMIAALRTTGDLPGEAARLSRLHSQPVYALCDPQWIADSRAMKPFHPVDEGRFPLVEKAISAGLRQWHDRIRTWGDYGFVDYYAGPHLGYTGERVNQKRYAAITYTLRPDLWLMYARSGDRDVRRFVADSVRTDADGTICHHDGQGKVKGLHVVDSGSDLPVGGVRKGQLPFYWESMTTFHKSSSTTMNNYAWDYYLTGNPRAAEIIREYCEGVKRRWNPAAAKRDGRPLVILRMLVGAYAFTWDPELRAMAEATMDQLYDPEAPLQFIQYRSNFEDPYATLYKTQVDIRALMEAWEVLGNPRYLEMSKRLSRQLWQDYLGEWPLTYTNPVGITGAFLYEQTGDPRYLQGLRVFLRQVASGYDPETDTMHGIDSAEKCTSLFEGAVHAQRTLMTAGAVDGPVTSWCGYEDFGNDSEIVFRKPAGKTIEFDIQTPEAFSIVQVRADGTHGEPMPWVKDETYGERSIVVPADAPEGDYSIVPAVYGQQMVIANTKLPVVICCRGYWRPAPAQAPDVRYYFQVPQGAQVPRIIFEGSARLYRPDGALWPGEEPLHGVVDLPADAPGLWAFEPVDNQLVSVRNLPPFFAVEDPESYFRPAIRWDTAAPADESERPTPATEYIAGALGGEGDQALYLGGKRQFNLASPEQHASGDGTSFLPFREGTIEFFLRPSWSTIDLPLKSKTICRMGVQSGDPWVLSYNMAPRDPDASLDFYLSHCLYGYFMAREPSDVRHSMRIYRRTVFDAGEWVHIAWVWGRRNGILPGGGHTKPKDNVLLAELYVNGRRGQHYNYKWFENLPDDIPNSFGMYSLDAGVDELRISDVQRYTEDFEPPSAQFTLDEHTRALFHFDGNVEGRSHGQTGAVAGEVK